MLPSFQGSPSPCFLANPSIQNRDTQSQNVASSRIGMMDSDARRQVDCWAPRNNIPLATGSLGPLWGTFAQLEI